jgi:octaprenyl-diphosphate synthase
MLVDDDLRQVKTFILERMASQVAVIPALAGHLIESGGKRLRPLLTLASARMCGYDGADHIKLATTVEFIHTATLLHDDVVDQSALRRGQATANIVWGNQESILVGDFLFSRAFQLMVETGSLKVLDVLSRAASVIAEGEVMQLTTAHNTNTTEDAYLAVISAKTAALFAAAAQVGAIISGRPLAEEEALQSYGRNLGIAFQLIDDVLDYSGQQTKLGKTVGDDFREGKVTLPVVLAYRRGDAEERRFWDRVLGDEGPDAGDFDTALQLLAKHRALGDTVERARHYGAIARDALAIFPKGPYRDAFVGLVDFCIARAY